MSKTDWSIEDSSKLYRLDHWGKGYFSVNDEGNITILPEQKEDGPRIDIAQVIQEMKNQKISFPAVIRFHDILRNEVVSLNETFRKVIEEAEFNGSYTGVYPIKVNQMREVVEEIVDVGMPYKYGLEAGSKSELLSVLAFNETEDALTILNGYKDEEYLRLGFIGRKLGRKIITVIEKYSELIEITKLAEKHNVEPMLGLRVKLSAKGTGKWAESGGERAKFGLSISELVKAINFLKEKGKESWVKLLHFHIGSQITDIRTIKDAITEGAWIYTRLAKEGLPLEYFDVGGGLGVDYDGSRSTEDSSTNYAINDYAENVIYILKQICDEQGVAHPNIVSESGRAITAKHACVIFKVFDQIRVDTAEMPIYSKDTQHMIVSNMIDLWEELSEENYQETYNDALQTKEDCINAFKLGVMTLEERGLVETIFWKLCQKINKIIKTVEFVPEELKELDEYLATQYLCNCSFFQSIPDSWAIDQLFPIIPVTRLNEKPEVLATLADATCDSDGKVDHFIHTNENQSIIPLHELQEGEDYYLGVFMTGAYQDVMGDMHNLFGKLNEVHVFCDDEDPSDFYIEEVIWGHSSEDILSDMQYNTFGMAYTIKKRLEDEVKKGKIAPREGVRLSDFYEECLKSYTYLEK